MLRAHRLNSKYLFCSCFSGAGYLFIAFPFMVELFVCFSSRTSFPFKVSRYTCGYSLIGFLHILYLNHHIIYLKSFSHHIIYLCTFRLSSIFLFCGNLFYSNSLYICTLRTWTLYWDKCVIVTNWTSFVLCTIFVASFFFSWWCPVFFFSSNPPKKKLKVATS